MTSPQDYYDEILGTREQRQARKDARASEAAREKLYADYIAALIAAKGTAEFRRQAASGELVAALEALP